MNIIGLICYIYSDPGLIIGMLMDMPFYLLNCLICGITISAISNKSECTKKPILLIYSSDLCDMLLVFIKWIFLRKYEVHTIKLPNKSLSKISVQNTLKKIYDQTGQPVNLIGHSIGGLIAAKYAKTKYVNIVITISTPFRGTPLFRYLTYNYNWKNEILPNSKFLTSLHHEISSQALTKGMLVPIICIGSKNDISAPLPWCSTYESKNCYNIGRAGHLSILFIPKLWKLVDRLIIK
jgi:predicted alpha/beta hydrolase family esterase